jgi:DNA-binding NarL/FixJ family response regulator
MLKVDAMPSGGRQLRKGKTLPAAGESTEGSGKPARILIVEDDYFVATGLEHALVDTGFEVVGIAVTAEQAVELGAAEQPELVIMDIRLAGSRDGIDAAVDLLSKHGIRSLFATAHGDEATRARAEKARPLGWLTKPYPTRLAVETIRNILGST